MDTETDFEFLVFAVVLCCHQHLNAQTCKLVYSSVDVGYCIRTTNLLLVLRVYVDKRITIGQLKTEMQRWVGVSHEHFKLFKIYSNRYVYVCTDDIIQRS